VDHAIPDRQLQPAVLPGAQSRHGGEGGDVPDIKLERRYIALFAGSLRAGSQPGQGLGGPEPEIREREQSRDGIGAASLSDPEDIAGRINYGADAIYPSLDSLTPHSLQKEDVLTEFRGAQLADKALRVLAASQGGQIGRRQPVKTYR
jgi:hypothetical protein